MSQFSRAYSRAAYDSISGNDVSVGINHSAIRTLQTLVQKRLNAVPGRNSKFGGLLLGADTPNLVLESVHPIVLNDRSELSSGSLWFRDLFLTAITELRRSSASQVIGHFRSHSEGEPEVTSADLAIAEAVGASQPLMLLVDVSATAPATCHLYIRKRRVYFKVLAFPLAGPVAEIQAHAPNRAADPPEFTPARPVSAATGFPRGPVLVTLLLTCVLFLAYSVYFKPRASAPKQDNLGLTAQSIGPALIVGWNHSSPIVANGTSGILTIQDGPSRRQIQLSAQVLRSENYTYLPESPTVRLRLEVNLDGDRFSGQTLTVDSGLLTPAPSTALPPKAGDGSSDKEFERQAAKLTAGSLAPPRKGSTKASQTLQPPAPSLEAGTSSPQPVRLADLLSAIPKVEEPVSAGSAPSSPESAEQLTAGLPPHLAQLSPLSSTPGWPAESPALPPAKVDPVPIRPELQEKISPAIHYVGPVPLRKVTPAISASSRHAIRDGVSIEITVAIDTEGKVVRATAPPASDFGQEMLRRNALQAALLWRFAPARRNGQPVESAEILKFNFHR